MSENEKTQLKYILKCLLISTPRSITVDELFSDYARQEGHVFPFRKFGFSCFIDFLLSIPDTVIVHSHSPRYVTPVIDENVKHINDMVLKQKVTSKKIIVNKKKMPVKKFRNTTPHPVPATEISPISNWAPLDSTNSTELWFNSSSPINEHHQMESWTSQVPDKKPWELQVPDKSCKSKVPNKKSQDSQVQDKKSWDSLDPSEKPWDLQVPGEKSWNSQVPGEKSWDSQVPGEKSWDSQVPGEKSWDSQVPGEKSLDSQVPGEKSWDSQVPGEKSRDSQVPGEKSWDSQVKGEKPWDSQVTGEKPSGEEYPYGIVEPSFPLNTVQHSSNILELSNQSDLGKCTSLHNNSNLYHDLIGTIHLKAMLYKYGTYFSVKGDSLENADVSSSSGVSSGSSTTNRMFGERTINNMRSLIKQNPQGIWCSEYPDLYKVYFGVMLEYRLHGYVSMIAVASAYPDIFHCVRRNSSDFLLFDAQQPIPEHYTRNLNFDSYCPVITSLFRNNLQRMLVYFPYGLKSSKLWETYKKYFDQDITAQNFGFPNTEHLLQKLQEEEAIHLRQVGKDLMIYPHTSYLTKAEPALPLSPLSHFNIMTQEETMFLASLYPYETVDWTHTIPQQKWLVEQTHVPVLISEVCSPSKFYIILEGSQYYSALDSLMKEIQEFYVIQGDKYVMPKPTIREGQFCVCPYNDEWHRARICKTESRKKKVEVYYIDFGTIGEVDMNMLRFMHYDFAKLPIQAIKASLANIKPFQDENWNLEANKVFLDLVFGKTLIAELEKISENGTVSIALVDTTGDDDIHINDTLVAQGYAEFERVFFPLTPSPVTENSLIDQNCSLESDGHIASSRNSSPAPRKGAGWGKVYLDSCFTNLKGNDIDVHTVNKNVFPDAFASICKTENKTDRTEESSFENNSWEGTFIDNSTKLLRKHDTSLKTNEVEVSYLTNVSNTTNHTSITEALPPGISQETSTIPFKSIWSNTMPPVTNPIANISTTHPVFSSTNETIPEVQIPLTTNNNLVDYSETCSKNWNQVNQCLYPGWTNSLNNVYSQPLGDLANTRNLQASAAPPGLGWNGMPYNPLNMNSDPLHAMSPQVIEAFSTVILQQQQQQAFLQSIVTGLLKICPSILNKPKETIFPPNSNISFPTNKPSINISEVSATPSTHSEELAFSPSTVENDSNHMSVEYGTRKYCVSQSEENIGKEIMMSGVDSINSDKNVKVQVTHIQQEKSKQVTREPFNELTELCEKFSLNNSLKNQSTCPYVKNGAKIKREVTDEETTLKLKQDEVDNRDHSKSKHCLKNENVSANKARVKPIRLIKKILIDERFLNLINNNNEPYFCADEVICTFTKFSGTQVVLKIIGQNKIRFVQVCRDENVDLFRILDSCDLNASCRKPNGKVHDMLHLISLGNTLKLLKILKVTNATILSEIKEELRSFNPNDEYWCLKQTLS